MKKRGLTQLEEQPVIPTACPGSVFHCFAVGIISIKSILGFLFGVLLSSFFWCHVQHRTRDTKVISLEH
jgi:hypothetical protein